MALVMVLGGSEEEEARYTLERINRWSLAWLQCSMKNGKEEGGKKKYGNNFFLNFRKLKWRFCLLTYNEV